MAQKDYELISARLESFEKNISEKVETITKNINDKIEQLSENISHFEKESTKTREEMIRYDEKFKSLEKENYKAHTDITCKIEMDGKENEKYTKAIHDRVKLLELEAERYKYKIVLIVVSAAIAGVCGGFLKSFLNL